MIRIESTRMDQPLPVPARRRHQRIARRIAGAVGVVALGLVAAWLFVVSASCAQGVDLEGMSDAQVADLRASGWTGNPTDGREALYPKGC